MICSQAKLLRSCFSVRNAESEWDLTCFGRIEMAREKDTKFLFAQIFIRFLVVKYLRYFEKYFFIKFKKKNLYIVSMKSLRNYSNRMNTMNIHWYILLLLIFLSKILWIFAHNCSLPLYLSRFAWGSQSVWVLMNTLKSTGSTIQIELCEQQEEQNSGNLSHEWNKMNKIAYHPNNNRKWNHPTIGTIIAVRVRVT